MNALKQVLRVVLSAGAGYFTIQYFNIDGFAMSVLFYLGLYIVVSLILEMIWRTVSGKISK